MQEQKTLTSIYINKKLLETAKELGLNISKICEHALKLYIQAIKQADQQIINKREGTETVGCRVAGGVGFEPTTTSLGGLRPILARLPAH